MRGRSAAFASRNSARFEWFTPGKLWAGFFAIWSFWVLFLSGLIGSPGVLQLVRLQNLLASKYLQANQIRQNISTLEDDAALIEKSKVVQQREIRRVLGYSAPDELIFEFSSGEPGIQQ